MQILEYKSSLCIVNPWKIFQVEYQYGGLDMKGIASVSRAFKGQSITDDANLGDAGGRAHPKT